MKNILAPVLVMVGLLLVVLSFFWASLFPPARSWTPEKNEQFTKLGTELTRLGFAVVQAENNPKMHSGENLGDLKKRHAEVKQEFDLLKSEMESARDSPANTGSGIKWLGVAIAAVGGVLIFLNQQEG
jgi:uncharacterized protein YdcH (DUF465 family)